MIFLQKRVSNELKCYLFLILNKHFYRFIHRKSHWAKWYNHVFLQLKVWSHTLIRCHCMKFVTKMYRNLTRKIPFERIFWCGKFIRWLHMTLFMFEFTQLSNRMMTLEWHPYDRTCVVYMYKRHIHHIFLGLLNTVFFHIKKNYRTLYI